jgi:predicted Zn-dependent peptidase
MKKPKFYRKVLSNGFTILFEKRELPIVAVAFAVRAGGTSEASSEKGASHFIEHLLFKGTKNRRTQKQIAEDIERNGGELNGFTEELITAYWCKIPSKKLGLALDVLSDLVKNPLFEAKEVEKERKVIFEEIKKYKDNPAAYVVDKINESLYELPFGTPLIGTYKTLSSLSREKILKRFKEVYAPNNMILCVVGDAKFEDLVKFVEKNFGKQKGKVKRFEIKKRNLVRTEKRKGVDQANLIFAYHVPVLGSGKSHAAQVLSALMASGMASRLFLEIREKRNLAYTVVGASEINKDFAYNVIRVGTTKENVSKVKEIILKEFEKVAKSLDKKELDSVKEQLIGNHHISMEDSVIQMTNLLLYEANHNAKDFYNFEKNIRKVKLEDVKKLAKLKKYSFFALVPD